MYGLIGFPLGHSFSADFFNKKFKREDIQEEYRLFPLESISEFPGLLEQHPDIKGLNVTIPYKQQVMSFLNVLSEEAREIGAVNVIKISMEGTRRILTGYNSDSIGFRNSLIPLLRPDVKKALVLGTGGASKAVVYVLRKLGIEVLSVSRTKSPETITYDEITEEIIHSHLLIVNTTPLGMWPNIEQAPDIPYCYLTPQHILYDLVYNPEVTEFMRRGEAEGATTKNGLEMLYGQALAAWDIWNA